MRIAIGGFALESVSFLPHQTSVETFERTARRGPDLIDALSDTESVGGGFIEVLENEGAEIVPLVYADAGTYQEAARRLDLDHRNVKAKIDPVLVARYAADTTRHVRNGLS